jgi:hypothetical protein
LIAGEEIVARKTKRYAWGTEKRNMSKDLREKRNPRHGQKKA